MLAAGCLGGSWAAMVAFTTSALAGMRPVEETSTRSLLCSLPWHPVNEEVAEKADELGRIWLPGHRASTAPTWQSRPPRGAALLGCPP